MLDFVIFVTFLFPAWGHPSPTQPCPTSQHPHTHTLHHQRTCYSIHLQDSFYVDAAKTCSGYGGSLATITTHSDNQFITKKLKSIKNNNPETKSDKFWIGLNTYGGKKVEMKGQEVKLLTWQDGSLMTYDNLQKDGGDIEKISPYLDHCVAMDSETGTWHELACTEFGTLTWDRKNPFICEFPVDGDRAKFPTRFTESPGISSATVPKTLVETTSENDGGSSSCPHTVCDLNGCNSLGFKMDPKGCFTCECNAATTTVSPNRITTDETTCPPIICDSACGMAFVFEKDPKGCVTCVCDTTATSTTTTTTTATHVPPATCRRITCFCDIRKFVFTTDAKGCVTCECVEPSEKTTILTTSAFTTKSSCPYLVCNLECVLEGFRIDPTTGCYLCACNVKTTPTPPPGVASCPPIVVCHRICPVRFVLDPVTGCGLCECDPDVTASTTTPNALPTIIDVILTTTSTSTTTPTTSPTTTTATPTTTSTSTTTPTTRSTSTTTPTITPATVFPCIVCNIDCGLDGYRIDPVTGCLVCQCDLR